MSSTLRILIWNANGLAHHVPELEIFLNLEKIDICLISESHLTETSFIKIRDYECYHAIHPGGKARGGSTVIVKKNIKHYEEPGIQEESMQVKTIKVETNNNKEYSISSIYCPPRFNLNKDEYNTLFKSLGSNFIIGGDFNAKNTHWGSRLTTHKGKELFEAGRANNCEFHSAGKPTYWPSDTNKIPDLIDFYVTKGIFEDYMYLENSEGLSSDHSPVIMTLSTTIINKESLPMLTNYKTNWNQFQKLIEEQINLQVPLKTPVQLEDELELFNSVIQQAAWESTPSIYTGFRKNQNYPLEVRELVREKRKARKIWQRTRSPENRKVLNFLCNKLKQLIKEIKNETISKYLLGLSEQKDTEYSLWKATKGLKRPKMHVPPIKNTDGTWAKSDQQKAALFANHLEETFQPLPRQTENENTTMVNKIDDLEIKYVTLQELKEEIKTSLKGKKAPGYDLITGQIVKAVPEKGLRKLVQIINAVFRLKYVPRQWKVAEVIMIPKPGKLANDRKSYRPIPKLFERLLLKRLKPIIEERTLIPPHQFGFRENHSTIEQVHRITDIIEKALENKKICSCIFLDVAQAFDKVWHQGLEFKLHRDLPKQFYQVLKSYIAERHFRVKIGSEYSELKRISAGIPQGSVLGPMLYILYTRDLPNLEGTTIATFADDTAILATGNNISEATTKLQKTTNSVNNWTKTWRIKLNETKSVHVNFTNQKVNNWIPVVLNSQQIPHANTAKYLGMTLDAKLKWKEHVKKKQEELNIKYRKMYWLIGRNSELSIHNKLLLYRQILKPIWTYGIQLWGCAKKTTTQMIQRFQNKVLRGIVNAPWYIRNDNLHRDLQMEYVSEEIKNYANKHIQRIYQHQNADIRRMFDTNNVVRRLQRQKPLELGSSK